MFISLYGKVLVIDPQTNTLSFLEGSGLEGEYKYSYIATAPDGRLFCAPRNAAKVLVIDPPSGRINTKKKTSNIAK